MDLSVTGVLLSVLLRVLNEVLLWYLLIMKWNVKNETILPVVIPPSPFSAERNIMDTISIHISISNLVFRLKKCENNNKTQ